MIGTGITEIGRMPPQNVEFEEAVLGALLLEKDAVSKVLDILKPESFYKEANQKIYNAIISLYEDNSQIDILTVSEKLRKETELDGVGGPAYISMLTLKVGSSAHIEYHARIIQQKFMQRELIRVSTQIQQQAYDESVDVSELFNFVEDSFFKIVSHTISKDIKNVHEVAKEVMSNFEQASKSEGMVGLMTGFREYDSVTNGLMPGNIVVMAGRPGMGKTTLALIIAWKVSFEQQKKVLVFSLEMSVIELVVKVFSSETKIQNGRLRKADFNDDEWKALESVLDKTEKSNLYIDDTPGITVLELKSKAKKFMLEKGLDLIVVDYLQLMQGKGGSREQVVSEISRKLKLIAKELGVPIIVLSQLNRSNESRPDKKPQLSDLRESGAIEQDADIVNLLHRPEYYGFMEYPDGESTRNIIEVDFAKFRAGSTPEIKLKKDSNFTTIYSMVEDVEIIKEEVPKILESPKEMDVDYNTNKDLNTDDSPF